MLRGCANSDVNSVMINDSNSMFVCRIVQLTGYFHYVPPVCYYWTLYCALNFP